MLDKTTLIDLYITKRKTTYEIAEMCGVYRSTVCNWLEKYDIDINPKQRKYELIKKIPFTQEQKDMIVGTVLGDGCIALHGRKNKSCRLMIGHCEKQKDFLMWKKSILANFVNTINKREDKKKNSIMYNFTTVTHDGFKLYRDLFYEGNKKVIKDELITHIKPLSLAVWFLDDGTLMKNVNMRLATDSFTKIENEKLQWILKYNFDIRSKVCEYTRHNNKFYYMSFNKENSLKMTEIIAPYAQDCMKYKLINRSSTTERQTSDCKLDDDIV
jgi:recombination protein RecA